MKEAPITTEVPTADWSILFKEIPLAVAQFESHDAHCAREAATLLDGAIFALKAVSPTRAWDELVPLIGRLATHGNDHRDELPQDTRTFLDQIEGAFSNWSCSVRETDDVVRELSLADARRESDPAA